MINLLDILRNALFFNWNRGFGMFLFIRGWKTDIFKHVAFSGIFFCLLAAAAVTGACDLIGEKEPFGKPTPIPAGKSATDVICVIQDEFRLLKKPVLEKLKYHKQWKVYKFADSTYRYGPFYEVVLTGETYAFCKRHTYREIQAGLTPLLFDPDIGGEVAVLFAGLPTKDLETASEIHCGETLRKIGYISPENKGSWDIGNYPGNTFIGYPGIRFDVYENPPDGTLDRAIYNVLSAEYAVRNYPDRAYYQPFEQLSNNRLLTSIDELRTSMPEPVPSNKFDQFIESHSDLFSSTVLLASQYDNITALMWTLGMQKEYWPLSIYKTVKDHTPFQKHKFKKRMLDMEDEFINKAGIKIYQSYMKRSEK